MTAETLLVTNSTWTAQREEELEMKPTCYDRPHSTNYVGQQEE